MAQDAALTAEAARLQQLKADISTLPRTRAPRNYTLDAAEYGRPATPWDVILRPWLQGTAALAALVFVFALVLTLLPTFSPGSDMAMDAPGAVMVEQAERYDEVAAVEVTVEVMVEVEREVEVVKEVEVTVEVEREVEVVKEVEVIEAEPMESAEDAGDMASEMDAMEEMEAAEMVMMDDAADDESVTYENAAASGVAPAATVVPDPPTPLPTDTPQPTPTATPAPPPSTPTTPTPDLQSRLSAVLIVSALFLCFCLFMLWLLRRGSD